MTTLERIGQQYKGYRGGIPLWKFPPDVSFQHGGIIYEAYKVTRDRYLLQAQRNAALPLEGILGYDAFQTPDEIRHNIQPRSNRLVEVVFARELAHNPKYDYVGVVTQEIKEVAVDEQKKRVLSIGVKAVRPDFQHHGIGKMFALDAFFRHDIQIVTGRTRSWRVFRTYAGLVDGISALDKPFPPEAEEILEQVLSRSKFNEALLKRRGLCLGIYPPADSKYFIPPANNVEGMRIYREMESMGVLPGNGNGLRYYAEANDRLQILEMAAAMGYGIEGPQPLSEPNDLMRRFTSLFRMHLSQRASF